MAARFPSSCMTYKVAASPALLADLEGVHPAPGDLLFSCIDDAASFIFENFIIKRTARSKPGYTVKIIVYDQFLLDNPRFRGPFVSELVRQTMIALNNHSDVRGTVRGRESELKVTVSEFFSVSS